MSAQCEYKMRKVNMNKCGPASGSNVSNKIYGRAEKEEIWA